MKSHIVACLGLCMPTLVHAAQQCSLPPDAPGFAVAETASTSNIQNSASGSPPCPISSVYNQADRSGSASSRLRDGPRPQAGRRSQWPGVSGFLDASRRQRGR